MRKIVIILGSSNDLSITEKGLTFLKEMGLSFDLRIGSAHRSPEHVHAIVEEAEREGAEAFICIAGMSAHLAGVVASLTIRPVFAVPALSEATAGLDSLLSMVNMPAGIPVATFGFGTAGFHNAAICAAQVLSLTQPELRTKLTEFRKKQTDKVTALDRELAIRHRATEGG